MNEDLNNFSSPEEMIKYLVQFNTQKTAFKDRFKRVYIFKETEFEKHVYPYTDKPLVFNYSIEKAGDEFQFKTVPNAIAKEEEYTVRFVQEIPSMAEQLDEEWKEKLKPSTYLVFQPVSDPEASPTILQL